MPQKDPRTSRPVGHDGTVFKCPQCKAILTGTDLPTFPFCSERCRLIDLGNWLEGKYTISRPVDPTDQLEPPPQSPPPPTPPKQP